MGGVGAGAALLLGLGGLPCRERGGLFGGVALVLGLLLGLRDGLLRGVRLLGDGLPLWAGPEFCLDGGEEVV